MPFDHMEHRRDAVIRGLNRMALDARDQRLSPTAQRLKGALFAYIGPKLAHDAVMPDLDDAVRGVDRGNVSRSRRLIGDRVRRMLRGKLGRDADLDDLEYLLEALEEQEEGQDDIEADPAREPNQDPWEEARDRRMTRDDPVDFPGMPRTGGSMSQMPNERDNDVRFPHPGEPADARDRMPRRKAQDFSKPRRHGMDTAATFSDRFGFTRAVSTDDTDVNPTSFFG